MGLIFVLDTQVILTIQSRIGQHPIEMPLIKSCSAKARAKNIKELINAGKERKVAVAIAYSVCRKLKKKK